MKVTISNVYANVNKDQELSCYDYNNYSIETGDISQYKITQRLGKGKYSEVFEGKTIEGNRIVIKVLKPVKQSKINREIMILKRLNHKSIIGLKDVVFDPGSSTFSLIFDYIKHHEDTSTFFERLNLSNLRFYCRQLLEAIEYAHSHGIVHRDVKPQNIIVDTSSKQLKLIDWGLAEFYLPEQEYSVRVASKYYKSPELLVGYPYYDYSLDVWSFGCVLAEFIFKKRPFFFGSKSNDQLTEIAKVLGTKDLYEYLQKYEIPDVVSVYLNNVRGDRVDLFTFVDQGEYHLVEDAVDLLDKIFVYDHQLRLTASECLKHRFFN